MCDEAGDPELGIVDTALTGERLKRRQFSQKLIRDCDESTLNMFDELKVMIVSRDAREEMVFNPSDPIRTMVDRFMEKSGGKVECTELVVMTSEGKVLDMKDTMLVAGVRTGDTVLIQPANIQDEVKTKTKHFPWHIISFTCWLLCLMTLVASLTAWCCSYDPPDRYLVLLDAGSVHTSVYTYRYSYTEPDTPVRVTESHFCELGETGISSFKADPSSAASFISSSPCVLSSIARVPSLSRPFSSILLGSTAGMRVLNLSIPDTTRQIMDSLTMELEMVSMGMKSGASIMSGEEEGVDGWVTANYLEGGLVGEEEMMGSLDWGGASSQITRMVEDGDKGDRNLSLYGEEFSLLARSNLCYGQAEALRRHKAGLVYRMYREQGNMMMVPDPCLPQGAVTKPFPIRQLFSSPCTDMVDREFMEKMMQSEDNVTFTAQQNQTVCSSTVLQLFTPDICQAMFLPQPGETTCMDPSTIPSPGNIKYLAFSTYWYLTHGLGLQVTFPLHEFVSKTSEVCHAQKNSTLLAPLGKVANMACFQAIFMTHLLTEGYHFNTTTWQQISFVKRIADAEVGWGLGHAIADASSLPPTEGAEYISLPLLLVLVSVSGILLLLGVASVLQVLISRRQYRRLQDSV